MIDEKSPIRHGLSARREPLAFQTQRDIVIPAGTILRARGGEETYSCDIGLGSIVVHGTLSVTVALADVPNIGADVLKRVQA